jgi:hypothetical protein
MRLPERVPPQSRMVLRLAIGATAALILLAPAPSAASHVFAVRGDVKIGSFAVRADGSMGGAIRAFGVPSSRRHTYGLGTCTAVWAGHGLTIDFYNLGGADACSPDGGRFSRAFLRGPHWMTTKRLRVGNSITKLRRLYPSARLRPGERYYWPAGYWLLERTSVIGSGGSYPGLLAEVSVGRVIGFQVRFPAGGD